MNRRQKKKAYKKKYGHNPPKTEVKYYGKKMGQDNGNSSGRHTRRYSDNT